VLDRVRGIVYIYLRRCGRLKLTKKKPLDSGNLMAKI
jgi:hypothetical protein